MNAEDRELLELAARALGFELYINEVGATQLWKDGHCRRFWKPLDDDGDTLRLMVALDLSPEFYADAVTVMTHRNVVNSVERATELYGDDKQAAVRRALVRAAAAIGKEMP